MTAGDKNGNGSFGLACGSNYTSLTAGSAFEMLLCSTLESEGYVILPVYALIEAGDQVCHEERGWCPITPTFHGKPVQVDYSICRRPAVGQLTFKYSNGRQTDVRNCDIDDKELAWRKSAKFFFPQCKFDFEKK